MEADRFVDRRVEKADPPQHVEYALTPLGRSLETPLAALCDWVVRTETSGGGAGSRAPLHGDGSGTSHAGRRN